MASRARTEADGLARGGVGRGWLWLFGTLVLLLAVRTCLIQMPLASNGTVTFVGRGTATVGPVAVGKGDLTAWWFTTPDENALGRPCRAELVAAERGWTAPIVDVPSAAVAEGRTSVQVPAAANYFVRAEGCGSWRVVIGR